MENHRKQPEKGLMIKTIYLFSLVITGCNKENGKWPMHSQSDKVSNIAHSTNQTNNKNKPEAEQKLCCICGATASLINPVVDTRKNGLNKSCRRCNKFYKEYSEKYFNDDPSHANFCPYTGRLQYDNTTPLPPCRYCRYCRCLKIINGNKGNTDGCHKNTNWTIVSQYSKDPAHFEDSIVVDEDDYCILTSLISLEE